MLSYSRVDKPMLQSTGEVTFNVLQEHIKYVFLDSHNRQTHTHSYREVHTYARKHLLTVLKWTLKHRSSQTFTHQTGDAFLPLPWCLTVLFQAQELEYRIALLSHTYFMLRVHFKFSVGSTVYKSGLKWFVCAPTVCVLSRLSLFAVAFYIFDIQDS